MQIFISARSNMDAMIRTPCYQGPEGPSTFLGTCSESPDLTYTPPENTMEEIYHSDTTTNTTVSEKSHQPTATNPMDWGSWRSADDTNLEAVHVEGQASTFEVLSPPTSSPFDEKESDSDQVKELKRELKEVQKRRDLFQAQYWRLRAEVVWLLSALRHEIDRRRDTQVELMTLQLNHQITEMNQRHLGEVVNHATRQYNKLADEMQKAKCHKEISEVENSSRKVLDETVL